MTKNCEAEGYFSSKTSGKDFRVPGGDLSSSLERTTSTGSGSGSTDLIVFGSEHRNDLDAMEKRDEKGMFT
jgi:hypothetical protein